MKNRVLSSLMALMIGLFSIQANAHHSVAAEYGGTSEPLHQIKGVVTNVQWVSPHVKITVDVKEGEYAGQKWDILGHAPGLMARTYDIMPDAVKVGSEIDALVWISKFGVPRSTPRAISVDSGPLKSTLRAADTKDIRDGKLGNIVPAPGEGEE